MKKILVTLTIIIIALSSCNNQPQSPEEIREQIISYKQQVGDLNTKITELEAMLDDSLFVENNLTVETKIITVEHFEHYITVTANVDAEQNVFISPQMNGQITNVYVKEGQRVSKGQLLARINSDVLQKNLIQLQTSLSLADTMYQKQKTLFDQNVVSEVQYLQAKNQKETLEKNIDVIQSQLALSYIAAPFSGIIDKVNVDVGELASPGQPIFQLVNLNTMLAIADISEKHIPTLNIGDVVKVTFPTYQNIEIDTKVYQKGNVIDATNRTFWLKVRFPNIKEQIKPNMLATIKLKDFEADSVIVVPTSVLNKDIKGWFLFTVDKQNDENVAKKTYVEIGISDKNATIINKGLVQGDIIITKGYNLVSNGLKIQINN